MYIGLEIEMASPLPLCLLMISCYPLVKAEWQFSTTSINVSEGCKAALQTLAGLEVTDPQLMAYY